MSDDLAARAAGIGTLAEPVRTDLYLYVAGEPDAVSREQAAAALGVPLHTAKFHLDRLVEEGLLDVEFRRLTGRSGPGAGRPSKLYRRSDKELSVSLPERRYDLAGKILAQAVDRAAAEAVPVTDAVRESAQEQGRRAGQAVRRRFKGKGRSMRRAAEALAGQGYEPRERDHELVLTNCPFDALVHEHTALVCGLNEAYVSGMLEGAECGGLSACLDPEEGLCCVKVRPVDPPETAR
jgi:predicted ArsR family transcriptional regulator